MPELTHPEGEQALFTIFDTVEVDSLEQSAQDYQSDFECAEQDIQRLATL